VDSGACPRFFPQTTLRPGVFSTENPPGNILNLVKMIAQISEEMIADFANLN
jgi:hypothetical protein